jgi:hypothetical protein
MSGLLQSVMLLEVSSRVVFGIGRHPRICAKAISASGGATSHRGVPTVQRGLVSAEDAALVLILRDIMGALGVDAGGLENLAGVFLRLGRGALA